VNVTVNTRHMEASSSAVKYVEKKAPRLSKYYDNVQSIEVVLDSEAGQPKVEMVVHAAPKQIFVAHHREEDLFAAIDQCLDKIAQQLRKHKEKLRDPQAV